MNEKDKAMARSKQNREYKVMIIRIPTGLDKKEDMNETLNRKIRNKIVEVKGTVNKIINMLEGENSSMEEQRNESVT